MSANEKTRYWVEYELRGRRDLEGCETLTEAILFTREMESVKNGRVIVITGPGIRMTDKSWELFYG